MKKSTKKGFKQSLAAAEHDIIPFKTGDRKKDKEREKSLRQTKELYQTNYYKPVKSGESKKYTRLDAEREIKKDKSHKSSRFSPAGYYNKIGKNKKLLESDAYNSGWDDAKELAKVYSSRFCIQTAFVYGFCRKSKQSEQKVYRYCEGFNDCLLHKFGKDQ